VALKLDAFCSFETSVNVFQNIQYVNQNTAMLAALCLRRTYHCATVTTQSQGRVTRREVPCSIPGRVLGSFQKPHSFCPHSVALVSVQPLTEMNTEEFPWG
jgi:hypothetical protein